MIGPASRQFLEQADFLWSQWAELAGGEALEGQRAHFNSREVADFVAQFGQDAAELHVWAFADGDVEDGFLRGAVGDADVAAAGFEALAALVGQPDSLFELRQHALV